MILVLDIFTLFSCSDRILLLYGSDMLDLYFCYLNVVLRIVFSSDKSLKSSVLHNIDHRWHFSDDGVSRISFLVYRQKILHGTINQMALTPIPTLPVLKHSTSPAPKHSSNTH